MAAMGMRKLRNRLMRHCAGYPLAIALFATPSLAQQRVPGTSPECPVVNDEAVCEGDLSGGILATPGTPAFGTLSVRNPTAPIAPPGLPGIDLEKNDRDIGIIIADGVTINTASTPDVGFLAQGISATVTGGFDLAIDSGARISASGQGIGNFAIGIEAFAGGGDSNLVIANRGDIEALTSFPAATAILARVFNSTGDLAITNSGALTAQSGGTGERSSVTAGIFALHQTGRGDIAVTNSGAITVSATTTDTDFNGIAAGIVTNSLGGANLTRITNSGTIAAEGSAVHAIAGFVRNDSADTAELVIDNRAAGAITIDGADNYGILAESAGRRVDMTLGNLASITLSDVTNATGLFALHRAREGTVEVTNAGSITGEGPNLLRGIGITTAGATPGGTYTLRVTNNGPAIDLSTTRASGMTIFATREDTVLAEVFNNGRMDLAETTNANSVGISVNLNSVDPASGGAVGRSTARIVNTGDITLGAGTGMFLFADDVRVTNSASIALAQGTGIFAIDFTDLAISHAGTIRIAGPGSDGIRLDASRADDWQVAVTETGSIAVEGAGSAGVRVTGVSDAYRQTLVAGQTAAVTINKAVVADYASNVLGPRLGNNALPDPVLSRNVPAPGAGGGESVVINGTVSGAGGNAIVSADALRIGAAASGARIGTTGDNAPVISGQTAVTLVASNGLALSSTGNNAPLFAIGGGGNSAAGAVLVDLDASTTGTNSAAFRMDSAGGSSIANFELYARDPAAPSRIMTTGAGSDAVRFVTSDSSIFSGLVHDSRISTSGAASHGFNLDLGGNSSNTLLFANSEITTGGTGSDAIEMAVAAGSDATLVVQTARVTTSGEGALGVNIPQINGDSTGVVVIESSTISTTGDNAPAFQFAAEGGGSSVAFVLVDGSTFSTAGNGSTAVRMGHFGVSSDKTVYFEDTTITTTGTNADGLFHGGGAFDDSAFRFDATGLAITTQGSNARGLMIDRFIATGESASSAAFDDVRITTAGAGADGLRLGASAEGASTGSMTRLAATGLDITTTGTNALGLVVEPEGGMSASEVTITLDNSTFRTSGEGAEAVRLFGLEGTLTGSTVTLASRNVDIVTSGAGANGFVVGSLPEIGADDDSRTTLTLELGAIATTGVDADAIRIGAGWGRMGAGAGSDDGGAAASTLDVLDASASGVTMLINEAVSASGQGSDALVTASLVNTLEIPATGGLAANRYAIHAEGSGGAARIVNHGTISGDIRLGAEDSTLISSGTITGNIDMGGGANAIRIEAGGLLNARDSILIGQGNMIAIAGAIAPGGAGPLQTTRLIGDIVFAAGSQFQVDVDGAAADPALSGILRSDRLAVEGRARIDGGSVAIASLTPEGDFNRQATFRILTATGGVTGQFAGLVADLPFLELSLDYTADAVLLNATRAGPVVPFASLALTPNQRAVATAYDQLEATATGDLDTVIDQLIFASTPQALTAFDTSSGEVYAALLAEAGLANLRQSRAALARARSARGKGWGIWGGVWLSGGAIDSDGNAAAVQQRDRGFDIGIDYIGADNRWALGMGAGWHDGRLTLSDRLSEAEYDSWQIGGYARFGTGGGGFTVSAAISLSGLTADVKRNIIINALRRTASGMAEIDSVSVSVESRYGLNSGGTWSFGPVVAFYHGQNDLALGTERGAGAVALRAANAADGQTRYGAGLFANWQTDRSGLDLSVQHVEAASNLVRARLAFAEGADAPFTILAPATDGSGLLTSLSGKLDFGNGFTIGGQLDGFFGNDERSVSGNLILGWRFR